MKEPMLFKVEPDPDRRNQMVVKAGKGPPGRKCKECAYFVRRQLHGHTYFKCIRYGLSNSVATDWRANWPACKLFAEDK